MAHKVSIIDSQTVPELQWNEFKGNPFDEQNIGKIKDNVGNRPIPVTSIPSPFAQMHLYETAFKFINEEYNNLQKNQGDGKAALERDTTYHKVVSNCLDLFEIMYSYKILGLEQEINVEDWLAAVLDDLAVSSLSGMRTFSSALKTYINNYNTDTSRFKSLQPFNRLILIYYKDKIIGGTSPFTGFFTMNDELPKGIAKHDGSHFFTGNIPLYKRDADFQKYINWFIETNASAQTAFKSLHQYIRNCRAHITEIALAKSISIIENNPGNIQEGDKPKFELLNINNQPLYLLGNDSQYGCKPIGDFKTDLRESDYSLNTRKIGKQLENPPIMLIRDSKKKSWKYYKGPMPEDINPDELLGIPVERRKIPVFNLEYPCLGLNDLLSKHVIQLSDYNINKDKFWTFGNRECLNILPPIKQSFFDYFTLDDLKKYLTIERLPSKAIRVVLRIPVKGDNGSGVIEYERMYTHVKPENVDQDSKGAIVELRLGLGIYPFYRVADNRFNDFYKISQYYDESIGSFNASFYRQDLNNSKSTGITRNFEFERTRKDEGLTYVSKYTELATYSKDKSITKNAGTTDDIRFDFISLDVVLNGASVSGLIIPDWGQPIQLSNSGTIAFDIGTSNTYVAYSVGASAPQALNTIKDHTGRCEPHIAFLHEMTFDKRDWEKFDFNEQNIIDFQSPQLTELMPSVIANDSPFCFPIRTVVNIDNDTDSSGVNGLSPLININIPFAFSTQNMREKLDKTYSHLKWGVTDPSKTDAKNRLQMFIEQLVLMGRNKLIQEGVNPAKAGLVWFKPLSMGQSQTTIFNSIWQQVYDKYFSVKGQNEQLLYSVTESWAPFFSYSRSFGPGKMYLNIDIGGGTSDILAFKDGNPELTTSFRFAGDNLYDDGLNVTQFKDNGILKKYQEIGRSMFDQGKNLIKHDIINYIMSQPNLRSADLMMFFLTQKEMVEKLKLDSDMQLIFLLHHAALFYHTAQIIKMKGCELPEKIGVSGNGAKLLEITNRDPNINKPNGLKKLVEKIFQHVYELSKKPGIDLEIKDNPKNATAEGGIIGLQAILRNPYADIESYNYSLGDETTLIDANNGSQRSLFKYTEMLDENDPKLEAIAKNVQKFLIFFFDELWPECNFVSSFGVNKSLDQTKIKKHCTNIKNINSALSTAVQIKRDFEKEIELNETMFFYPIRALIYDLSKILNDPDQIKKITN